MATHYDVLGVAPDASPQTIRAAYRERARRLHPDRVGACSEGPADAMAAVNEAYRVLGEPGRRALYDRSLRAGDRPVGAGGSGGSGGFHDRFGDGVDDDVEVDVPARHDSRLSPPGPARVPWRAMLLAAAIGSAVIIFTSFFNDSPTDEPPDGIIRSGSCVALEPNGDAREVACTGVDDIVVDVLVPTEARCPAGTVGHRDRLGLGTACIAER